MNFSIRPFHHSDAQELWQLHVVTVLASGFSREIVDWDTDLHSIAENYIAKGGRFLVAQAKDKNLVGMGGYIPSAMGHRMPGQRLDLSKRC